MKKQQLLKFSFLFFMIMVFLGGVQTVHADGKVVKKGELISNPLGGYDSDVIEFNTTQAGFIVLDMDISLHYHGTSRAEKITIQLYRKEHYEEDVLVENDTFDYFPEKQSDLGQYFDYTTQKSPKGSYKYYISNYGTHTLNIKYTITQYTSLSTYLRYLPKTAGVKAGSYKLLSYLGQPVGSRCIFEKIISSNPKIAEAYITDEYPNKLVVVGYKPGTCTITASLATGKKYNIKVVVSKAKTPTLHYTTLTCCKRESFQNTLYSASGKVTWKSSNTKIATVDTNGKITAKGIGKCTITATNKGKQYKCTVTVQRQWPDFDAFLTYYYTRDNYFEVKIKNRSNKTLVIQSGIKVEDKDYKSYDRSIRLPSPITIKPGKTATAKFYVVGSTTWYDYTDFTLHFKFKFDSKLFECHVWNTDSSFYNGSDWYHTYNDEELHGKGTIYTE